MSNVFSKNEKVFLEIMDISKKEVLFVSNKQYNQFLEVLEKNWGKLPIGEVKKISLGLHEFDIKHPSLGLLEVYARGN